MKKTSALLLGVIAVAVGCRQETPVRFEPNLVHTHKYEIQNSYSMTQAAQDTTWAIGEMFGTPDEPRLPDVIAKDEELASLLTLAHLNAASGTPAEAGHGLYVKHCADCHGITGNGRGPTAAIITPYPRDYRAGIYKYKTTTRGSKPLREDIAQSIRVGIAGTAMRPIEGLTEDDIQALTDYVIYLSIRGETERMVIDTAVFDLDLEGGERIINPALKDATDDERKATFAEQWELIQDTAAEIATSWLEAADNVVEVPEPPADIPVANNHEEFVSMTKGPDSANLQASVDRGKELFRGKIAACSKCHGDDGLGNGQTTDYDDWTKDWTTRIGLDPSKRDALVPLLARGALPPQTIHPRNFTEGYFRGGDSAADLWIRIAQGIEGSPMPASTFVEGEFEEDDVWHLINFVRSLQTVETIGAPPVTPSIVETAMRTPQVQY